MRLVDTYIESLPEERRDLCEQVRAMIFELVPGVEEKLSFRIPFYHYFGMFMFLNNTKTGIDVVFCRGKDLLDEFPQLTTTNRAIMAGVCITRREDIRTLQLKQLILTAAGWNEEARRLKIPFMKKKKK
jgi:hypothetical protein